MKIALLTDTHAGARNDSTIFNDYFLNFYRNQFFPTIREREIDTIIHLGDLFDRRKFINFHTLTTWKKDFFDVCKNFNCHFILGNHDIYYKNTNDVASTDLLLREYDFNVYDKPCEMEFDSLNILFMPWINSENYQLCLDSMNQSKSSIMFGHFEINGFEMHRGAYCNSVMENEIFKKFDTVLSGHFHHKSDNGNVYYLGTPYELTWQDYADKKGFHIFDTEKRELEFIPNESVIYKKVYYNDENKDFTDIVNQDYSEYKDCYVKVVVEKKNDSYLLERLVQKIEEHDPINVMVVDNLADIFMEEDMDEIQAAEDTMSIVSKYIEALETEVDKEKLDFLMKDLYNESLQTEFNLE